MKLLANNKITSKISKILRSKRGETLMEGIVSVLILGMLMAAVVSIIQFSLRTTGDAILESTEAQRAVNRVINDYFEDEYEVAELTFGLEFNFYDGAMERTISFDVTQDVHVNTGKDNIMAFYPIDP